MTFKFRRSTPPTNNEKGIYAPAKRKLPKWQWYLLALVILSPLLYLLGKWIMSLLFVTASGYITTDSITIRAPYDAYVTNLNVHLTDNVQPGDTLISLDSPSLSAQIATLQTNIALLKIQQQGHNNKTLPELQKLRITAQIHVVQTENYYKKFQQYYKQGLITVIDLSVAEDRYNQAKISLEQIQSQIAKNQEDFSITGQQNYDQILGPEEAQLAALQAIQNGLVIKAEQAGVITGVNTQNLEFVKQGMSLLTLSTIENWHVAAFFEGKDVTSIHPGAQVKILLPDFTLLSGHIINQPSTAQSESQTLVVLQNPEQKLVAYINFDKPLPEKYQVNGLHIMVIIF